MAQEVVPWAASLLALSSATSSVAVDLQGPANLIERVERGLLLDAAPVRVGAEEPELEYELKVRGTSIELRSSEGDTRVVGLVAAPDATARRVVIIVADAARRRLADRDLDIELPDRVKPHRLAVELASVGWWWADPGQGQLGLELSLGWRQGPLRLGARGAYSGWCCGWRHDGLEAEVVQLRLAAEVQLALHEQGRFSFGMSAELGGLHEATRSRATVFASPAVEERASRSGVHGRLGAMLALGVSERLDVLLRAGAWAADSDLQIRLPEAFGRRENAARGVVGPWLSFGARLHLF